MMLDNIIPGFDSWWPLLIISIASCSSRALFLLFSGRCRQPWKKVIARKTANANGITTGRNKLGMTFALGLFVLTWANRPISQGVRRLDKRETARWIRGLISQGKLHLFYISAVWRRTRERALKQQHYECQRCKAKGRYERATVAHHKKYLRRRPDLALDLDNLEALCDQCHYEEHHKNNNKYADDEKW